MKRKDSGLGSRARRSLRATTRDRSCFLNVPYDPDYEELYLAFIAGLCSFGLIPRATIEITESRRRLERIADLIGGCRFSFHDLSRVELDNSPPATPRFNMPFELGLTVARATLQPDRHQWFVFEAQTNRLKKSLSDLDGTDPYIHDGHADGVLRALTNALSRVRNSPTLSQLRAVLADLENYARSIKADRSGSLFEARPFEDLVVAARMIASKHI